MTKSVSLELAKDNITVNAICPGFIGAGMSSLIPEKYQKQILSNIAMGRPGSPEEVASLVAYLASKESSYITGAVIDIDGGWS
jgi:NAD(P)-dependent dehydrogenase (short-subunit alcohol dehydrogenase family)